MGQVPEIKRFDLIIVYAGYFVWQHTANIKARYIRHLHPSRSCIVASFELQNECIERTVISITNLAVADKPCDAFVQTQRRF